MRFYGNFERNSLNIYRNEKSFERKLSRKMKHDMPSTLFPESYEFRDSWSKGYLCCVNLRTIRQSRFESLQPKERERTKIRTLCQYFLTCLISTVTVLSVTIDKVWIGGGIY
jgi:hypothetical protein